MNSTCPKCGSALRPGAKFCSVCGHQFSAPAGGSPHIGTQRLTSPRLVVRIWGQPDKEVVLVGAPVTIGRDLGNQIVVPLADVSRHHAQVVPFSGGYAIVDSDSANGTHLRGKRIPTNQPVSLMDGDVVRVGDNSGNSISITYLSEEKPPAAGGQKMDLSQAQLGNNPRFSIGRDPQSDLEIQSPVVSWRHAEVVQTASGHQINDLNSTNGTYVNGKRIRTSQLAPGDEVQIGPLKLVYSRSGFTQESQVGNVRLDGIRLRKEVPDKKGTKVILNDVSLTVMPREFVALVGGSGAGKSTLMDALNGFRRVNAGQVLFNGDNLYRNYDAYRTNLGYVPQSDILHTSLPVQRTLRYIAMLRLPPDTKKDVVKQRIDAALQQVEMLPQVDQPIQVLSGGQRKRVSIASELLSDPSLFFLDEPTSGLDPGLDKKMMGTLRLLADSGRTILLTTHATSNIIGQCDLVAFMSYGRLVYYGPPDQAIRAFGVTDFADIYSKLDTPAQAEQWERTYKQSPEYQKYVAARQANLNQGGPGAGRPRINPPKMSFGAMLRQFGILSMRYLDLIFKDSVSMFVLLAVMPIIGLLVLLIANPASFVGDSPNRIQELLVTTNVYSIVGETQKLLFILALSVILLGVFAASYEIIKERPIYRRERMVNLRIAPYLFSKFIVLLGFGFIQVATLMIVVGLKVDYPKDGLFLPAWLEIYVSLIISLAVGLAIGLLISAAMKSSNTVIYLVLVVLFIQIIFSGVLFELPSFAASISNITPIRWNMEGLGAIVGIEKLNEFSQTRVEIEDMGVDKTQLSPVEFIIGYEPTIGHLATTWLIQLVFIILLLSGTSIILRRQDYQT